MRARGVSLLEVLFAMGILLVGLLGVGAMIPAGRHEVLAGGKLDHSSAIGRQAFRDLKVRGYLQPVNWRLFSGPSTLTSVGPLLTGIAKTHDTATYPTVGAVIDPLGVAAGFGNAFPYGASGPLLTRIIPFAVVPPIDAQRLGIIADLVFRSVDDLEFQSSDRGSDFPPIQKWFSDSSGREIRRISAGSYSWLATIVTDPIGAPASSGKVTVSVAVIYKRDLTSGDNSEHIYPLSFDATTYDMNGNPTWTGKEVTVRSINKPLKPGQWIMLAGTKTIPTGTLAPWPTPAKLTYASWFRVLGAAAISGTEQKVTLAGPDWNVLPRKMYPNENPIFAWAIDGVIAVYEKQMALERN